MTWIGRRPGTGAVNGDRGASGRARGTIGAVAIASLVLLGATPALAEEQDPAGVAAGELTLIAVDQAGGQTAGAAFLVQGPAAGADGAEDWQTGLSVTVLDNTGVEGYAGADTDPAPGIIRVTEFSDGTTGAHHAVAEGERYRALAAATSEELAGGGEWQPATAGLANAAAESATRIAVPVAPAAPEPPAEGAPAEEPPAEEPPADEPPVQEGTGGPTITPFALGPDGEGVAAPYIYWRSTDGAGNLVPGARFIIHGPKMTGQNDDNSNNWGGNSRRFEVTDFTGQPGYTGIDKDPDVGEFLVTRLKTSGSGQYVEATSRYRLQQTGGPAGYEPPANTWKKIPASSANSTTPASGAWVLNTYDFGDFATPLVSAPFLVWRVTNTDGSAAPGATVTLQGPASNNNNWGTSYAVPDCTSLPCTGLDVDPEPGAFQVKYLTPATNPNATPVVAGSRYRVRIATAPAGTIPETTDWAQIGTTGSSGTWNNGAGAGTHDFGALRVLVPAPAKITVQTGGDRTGTAGVTGLEGVVLRLNTGTSSPSGTRPDGVAGDGAGWARCVSDATGLCTFDVPDTQTGGANRDARYWVVQSSAPAGWYMNPVLRTGSGLGAGSSTAYQFRTGTQLRSGSTYASTSQFMFSTGGSATSSGGVWQQSRLNPVIDQGCGIDVALIMDYSTSVDGYEDDLRDAADTFVDSLSGTPSRMSLFSFSDTSPASNASQNFPALTSVATPAQASAFKARYASWSADGGTNWDRGLAVPAAANTPENHFDVAVVITDGSPTNFGTGPSGDGLTNRLVETENGIFSANLLKAGGTRVIAFGVGSGATGAANALNLRAISGPTSGSDFYQTSDYSAVGQQLRNLALGACAGQLTITKMVVPNTAPTGSIQGAAPAVAGWTFTASDPGPGLTLPDPASRTTVADTTGTVAFPLGFDGATTEAALTVTETQQAGYTLVPVNGQNAICVNRNTGEQVTPTGNPTNGVRVVVPSTQTVNCTIYNRAPDETSTVKVDKYWVVEDTEGEVLGTYHVPGDEGPLPDGLAATLLLNGPGGAGDSAQPWGTVRANYKSSDSVKISEQADVDEALLPGCEIVSQLATKRNGEEISEAMPFTSTLIPGPNTFEVTNTVVCDQTLELVKVIDHGSASPSEWTLTATAPDGALAGPSGNYTEAGSVKAPVTAGVSYGLAESGGEEFPEYVQNGDWSCTRADGAAEYPVVVDQDGGVRVPLGQNVTCKVHNTTAELTVFKDVASGPQEPSRWTIDGSPASGVTGLPEVAWEGAASGNPSAPGEPVSEVRPGHTYTLSERVADGAVLSYLLTRVQKWDGNTWVDVPKTAAGTVDVSLAPGEHAYYRFVNSVAPSVALPLTGGIGAETVMLGGAGIGLLAAILGVLHHRRRRRGEEVV